MRKLATLTLALALLFTVAGPGLTSASSSTGETSHAATTSTPVFYKTASAEDAAQSVTYPTKHHKAKKKPKRPKLPWVLKRIRGCESGSGPNSKGNYKAQNSHSTASGGFQFLDSTWKHRYGVRKARHAEPWKQDKVAIFFLKHYGTGPWAASRHCWG